MKPWTVLILLALITLLVGSSAAATPPPPPQAAPPEVEAALADALQARTDQDRSLLTLDLFDVGLDSAFLAPDGQTATLWLALHDRETGRVLATEPGLALAKLAGDQWQVIFPGDPDWDATLSAVPSSMLPAEVSPAPEGVQAASDVEASAYTGYKLPYAAGTAHWLEGSVMHFMGYAPRGYPSCTAEFCRYAYDFTDDASYPLVAAKAGTVLNAYDNCTDGSETCTNYIVLKESSGLYQIYLHISHGTIPNKLVYGVPVKQGEFIGFTDDTGYSTSMHVHFMVTNDIWVGGDGYYWGHSVDIRFADVAINNGTPRSCYEAVYWPQYGTQCLGDKSQPLSLANDWFISGNVGAYPPDGVLQSPAANAVVGQGSNPLMDVKASLSDDVGIQRAVLIARIGSGEWSEVSAPLVKWGDGTYNADVDLCASKLLNGPVEVALRVQDTEGNVAEPLSARTIQVDHACPPPSSQMNAIPSSASTSSGVQLTWSAVDAGAGLGSFEVQANDLTAGSGWQAALTAPGTARQAWFVGQMGHSYQFRMQAVDTTGLAEGYPASAEASVTIDASCTPDSREDGDDQPQGAFVLSLNTTLENNLCGAGDADWSAVTLPGGGMYELRVKSVAGGAAARVDLYLASNPSTPVLSFQAGGAGFDASRILRPSADTSYLIRVRPLVDNLAGTNARYSIRAADVSPQYLPQVGKQ